MSRGGQKYQLGGKVNIVNLHILCKFNKTILKVQDIDRHHNTQRFNVSRAMQFELVDTILYSYFGYQSRISQPLTLYLPLLTYSRLQHISGCST